MAEPSGGMEKALSTRVAGIPAWALGTVISALIIGLVVWRNKNKKDTSQTQNDQGGTNPQEAQDPNAVDPATGLTYAEEGSSDTAGYPGTPLDSYLAQNPTNPAYPTGLTPQGLPGPVTNAQWSRLAADYLLGKGDDPSLVESALSKYINGTALSVAEQAIVNTALTTFGSPPEGVKAVTTTSGVPAAPGNLHKDKVTATTIQMGWDKVAGAAGYKIFRQSGTTWKLVGTNVGHDSSNFTDHGLKKNTTYKYQVDAFNTVGTGARSATLSVKTNAK